VSALEDAPVTNEIAGSEAVREAASSEPYPPALAAAVSTEVSPVARFCWACKDIARATPGALEMLVEDEALDLNMVVKRRTINIAVAPILRAVAIIENPPSLGARRFGLPRQ
jgi:hypothetical protein